MKNNKNFSCVEMKRKSAEKIYREIKNLSIDEELKFWHNGQNSYKKNKTISLETT